MYIPLPYHRTIYSSTLGMYQLVDFETFHVNWIINTGSIIESTFFIDETFHIWYNQNFENFSLYPQIKSIRTVNNKKRKRESNNSIKRYKKNNFILTISHNFPILFTRLFPRSNNQNIRKKEHSNSQQYINYPSHERLCTEYAFTVRICTEYLAL